MTKNKLQKLFKEIEDCKENKCILNKKNIKYMFKPDDGLKDESIKKAIFGYKNPKLCDCIIKIENIVILEIKCGKITKSILNEIIEQLDNVAKILKYVDIKFSKVIFIYDSFENNKLKQTIINKLIQGKRLEYVQYKNKAVELI